MFSVITVLKSFICRQPVFFFAACAACCSMIFVHPSVAYLSYIDWNTIALLFSLMITVRGLEQSGLFAVMGARICLLVSSARQLGAVLVFLTFFSSMFITNDVALLTFVPFTLALFGTRPSIPSWCCRYIIVLQTVAANTGSMLTPVGNPQNLFLFSQTGMSLTAFMGTMLPYTIISGLLLCVALIRVPALMLQGQPEAAHSRFADKKNMHRVILYGVLFLCCLLAVVRIIPKPVLAVSIVILIFFADRRVLFSIDYVLLLTFFAFFIFTGNIGSVAFLRNWLESVVRQNELVAAIGTSQIISNVPATLLLYPFAKNVRALLAGVNIGGLGSLVASLASLISYNLYIRQQGKASQFLAVFTFINVVFLLILTGACLIIG